MFMGLGDLPGGIFFSFASAVSADGSVAVGWSSSAQGQHAFRWEDGVMTDLGVLPGKETSAAKATSADGSVVVGHSHRGAQPEIRAFRWENGAISDLGILPGSFGSNATAISWDGSVIIGNSGSPFRWQDGVLSELEIPGLWGVGDMSADASVIVGVGPLGVPYGTGAVRWDGDELVGLGTLEPGGRPRGGSFSRASAVSADGSVVVGSSNAFPSDEAFRWENGFMLGLGRLEGNWSGAIAVSADGSIVIGESSGHDGPFLWNATDGMQSLQHVLEEFVGHDLAGWRLTDVGGISADGRTIVGKGFNPDGEQEAWIAVLPGLTIEIDIKPGSRLNRVNAISRGVVPVAILGSDTFNVEDIDLTTLIFGPNGVAPRHALTDPARIFDHLTDVNEDGFTDLVTHYRTQGVGFVTGDAEACVSGELLDETPFEGCDNVEIFDTRSAGR
jgi:probable HAF family extracellular repeat protein